MNLITIDQDKCKRDGMCVKECPAQIIVLKEKGDFPSLITDGEEFCINCGHCMAVCPHGALTLKTMSPAACQLIQKDLLPEAIRLCESGGMIHFYSLVSLEGEHLECIRKLGGEVLAERMVRSYSPGQWHAVYDVRVKEA